MFRPDCRMDMVVLPGFSQGLLGTADKPMADLLLSKVLTAVVELC